MKSRIAVLGLVLVVRACCCAVVSYNNFTDNDASTKVDIRAIDSNANNRTDIAGTESQISYTEARKARSNSTNNNDDSTSLLNVVQCFESNSLFKCFNDRVGLLFKLWREALFNSVRRDLGGNAFSADSTLGNNLTQLGHSIYESLVKYLRLTSPDESRSNSDELKSTNEIGGTRGHHKKKKVHKAIKKIVLKIIIGIFLLLIKKKMLLHMLQSLVITKFIITVLVYVATLSFKIWYELKQAKKHHKEHDKGIIYYDHPHEHPHEHHEYHAPYETFEQEHEHELDDHHSQAPSLWGNLWGRSYAAPTQLPSLTSTAAFQHAYRRPWPNAYLRPATSGGGGGHTAEYS